MKDFEQENKDLEEIVEFKSDLISMMSHQLRTSLSASKWVLKMFLDGELGEVSDEQKIFLKKTYENNEKMINLVSEMIDVNKENNTELTYTFAEHDIVEIIDEVITEFAGEAKQRKVKITFTKPKEIILNCDSEKIRTALQGLIENAIKYNKEGGDVLIDINKEQGNMTISIKDTGIGINEEEQSGIFEKFFRAKNAKKKESVGSGLGLFAAKSIIKHHKGKIWFESKEGVGSTFFISLPIIEN